MKILLHICCGPCAIMPIRRLLEAGHSVTGYFFNPNIHPLSEYLRRREGAAEVASRYGIEMIWETGENSYNSMHWMAMVQQNPAFGERCKLCWAERVEKTCTAAAFNGFDAFSSTLLYSRYQDHQAIIALSKKYAQKYEGQPSFYYQDFRTDWQEGIDVSKEWEIYRQPYCGCLYSENERYAKKLKRSNEALNKA